MSESKPLRQWMQSVAWPDNAPDWSPLGKIDCVSLEEALSMIASTSSMPITTRRYYSGASRAIADPQMNTTGWYEASISGFNAGLSILEQRQKTPIVPEQNAVVFWDGYPKEEEMPLPKTLSDASYVSVAPSDYDRMCRRDAQWGEMIEKLRSLSGQVQDLLNEMEKL